MLRSALTQILAPISVSCEYPFRHSLTTNHARLTWRRDDDTLPYKIQVVFDTYYRLWTHCVYD